MRYRPITSTLFPYTTLFRSTVCGEAVDGIKAIEKAEELHPDLILLDVSMPNLDGISATPQIRKRRSEEHTSELQSPVHLVCRLLLEKKKKTRQHLLQELDAF